MRNILSRLYGLLLNLYPKTYQDEYGDELMTVFNLSLGEAMKIGRVNVAGVLLRELTGLPKAILYEHLRERRAKMTGTFASRFDFPRGSRMEPWAVLLPFVLKTKPICVGHGPGQPSKQ